MLAVALKTLSRCSPPSASKQPVSGGSRGASRPLASSFNHPQSFIRHIGRHSWQTSFEAPKWTRSYTDGKGATGTEQVKEKAPSYASFAMKPKPVPRSERVPWVPPTEMKKDPWRITTGNWYSPALKAKAVEQQIIERDWHLPEPTQSTPPSLPYPSTEAEERLLTEMLLAIDSTPSSQFTTDLLPYFDSLTYYKQINTTNSSPPPISPEKFSLQLSSSFSVLQALPAPESPSTFVSSTPIWIILSYLDSIVGYDRIVQRIIENEKLAETHGESIHSRPLKSSESASSTTSMLGHSHDVMDSNGAIFDSNSTPAYLTPDQARILSETSEEHLKVLLPALVEADVYYAAEVINGVLKRKLKAAKLGKYSSELTPQEIDSDAETSAQVTESRPLAFLANSNENSPILEISQILQSTLNPRQLTGLLPAMCRTNAEWREDGFFDLMVDVLSTGGVLRWEPTDIAAVISALPKVPIAADYFTPAEIDPANPDNADKTSDELLKIAQKMAPTRWDAGGYGLPGDFYLRPSKEDIEAAKREFDEVMMEEEEASAAETASSPIHQYPSQNANESDSASAAANNFKRTEKGEANKTLDDEDLLAYLDVGSASKAPEEVLSKEEESISPPAFYNPIAWQPEEIGRLVGTMLSQELELDDIVGVICTMATEHWEEEAGQAPWHAYMGYISSVVSEALTTNKHWVDEDYSWVLHDVIATIGPWALRKWPEYRVEEHQKWLSELVAQIAIKYGRFKHDYRFIQIALNMICDNWPEHEHQKLSDVVAYRMKDRTLVGRTKNWYKWRISHEYDKKFSDQRAAASQLWIAPYNVGNNPKMPNFVESAGLRDPGLIERITRAITDSEEQKLTAPSRTGAKPMNEISW